MRGLQRGAGLALVAGLCAGIAWGTRVPYAIEPEPDAAIRLSWRAAGEPSLHCRTPSAEELARLPLHMRRKQICERRLPSFRLVVAVDGGAWLDELIAPGGAQHDRPAVVLRELRVTPGAHQLRVELTPEDPASAPQRLDAQVVLHPRAVVLVSEDPQSGALALRHAPR